MFGGELGDELGDLLLADGALSHAPLAAQGGEGAAPVIHHARQIAQGQFQACLSQHEITGEVGDLFILRVLTRMESRLSLGGAVLAPPLDGGSPWLRGRRRLDLASL